MRLNIGAGNKRMPGYTGIDAVERPAADIVAPAWAIPLDDGVADEILAVHLWEHFYRWQCDMVIKEWHRLLKPGGDLCLELPDFWKCCENVLSGVKAKHPDQLSMWGVYGDPRDQDEFMCHRWGWTPATLTEFLTAAGFVDVRQVPTQFHRAGAHLRDMRIEARKP
ncbi:MAG: methyltransferase domain-containing protein [Pseudomonadota bacterium]